MGGRQRKPRSTPAGRFIRGRRLDRNPLRRPSDRTETLLLILLAVTFLVAAPFAAAPDGAVVTRLVPVPVGTVVGARLPLWTTRDGQPASPPMDNQAVASLTVLGLVAGVAALAVVLALAAALARWSLNRRRLAGWDADWEATGPRWTTRA
jgi:hypothetical protein